MDSNRGKGTTQIANHGKIKGTLHVGDLKIIKEKS